MKIGVLGAGQLGRMLALSAYPLGHQMRFLALSEEDPSSLLGKTYINSNADVIKLFSLYQNLGQSKQYGVSL